MSTKKPLRSKLASSVSRSAAALSRATGRGDGSVIGGKIGLMIDPNLLANLSAGRDIALISGTNGKTTTTRLTAAALSVLGPVATNSFGANMPTGHTSALARAGDTPYAVLEVDEHYLPQVLTATRPRVVALLNLSRDQLDRAKEVAMIAELWRDVLAEHPVHVVANADDPMITWAAQAAVAAGAGATWVAAGQRWHDDSWVCPECGAHIERATAPPPTDATPPPPTDATPTPTAPPTDATPPPATTAAQPTPTAPDPMRTDESVTGHHTMTLPAVPVDAVQSSPEDPPLAAPASIATSTVRLPVELPDHTTVPVGVEAEMMAIVTVGTQVLPAVAVEADTMRIVTVDTQVLPVVAVEAGTPVAVAGTQVITAVAITDTTDATTDTTDAATDGPMKTAGELTAPEDDWWCTGCDLRRPSPQWHVDGDAVVDPTGRRHVVRLALPGRVNRANAATALAVASRFGVDPAEAVPRLAGVASIAGRYAQVDRDGRNIRLLLAKNPAGWLEAFDMAEDAPTLLSINSRDPDGLDTSWLFDVDFAPLSGRRVLITGERAFDLAVRLEVNDVEFVHVRTFGEALAAVPPGRLEVIANYTAFQDIRAELDRVN